MYGLSSLNMPPKHVWTLNSFGEEKLDEDPPPIFEWIVEMPPKESKLLEDLERKRPHRHSYFDSRQPSETITEPNRVLHDYKMGKMESFIKGVERNPKSLERIVDEKRGISKGTKSYANYETADKIEQRSFERPGSFSALRLLWSASMQWEREGNVAVNSVFFKEGIPRALPLKKVQSDIGKVHE